MLKSAVGAQGIVEGGVGATVVEKAEKVGLVIADDLARAVDAHASVATLLWEELSRVM